MYQKDPTGRFCYEAFHGLDRPCEDCTNAIIMKNGRKSYRWEHHNPILKRDFLITDRIIKWPDDRDVRLEIATDITELKKKEKALRKSNEIFRIFTEESPFGIALIDTDGRYRYINSKFRDIFGYQLEDIPTGEAWFRKAFPDETTRHQVVSTWEKDKAEASVGEARPRTFTVRCKDGSGRIINFIPVTMSSGDQFMIYEDITLAKKMETQLQQATKMEAIGTVAGGIAHEFNNILHAIIGNAELAMEDVQEQNPLDSLKEIKDASLRAADIVNQLIDLSHEAEVDMQPIDAIAVIRNALEFLRSTLPASIEIHKQIPDTDVSIFSNRTQLKQVMINLSINAFQAMEGTGGTLDFEVEKIIIDEEAAKMYPELKAGDYLKIIVSDTGPGIKPEIVNRIFDPYFTTKDVGEGSGMGLAFVHRIVQNHNGTIAVDSAPGEGTTFTIFLPVERFSDLS